MWLGGVVKGTKVTCQIHFWDVLEVPKTQFFHCFMEQSGAKKLEFCYIKNYKFKKTDDWSFK